jgi:FimV-like protein
MVREQVRYCVRGVMRLHLAKALIEANDKAGARREVEMLLKLDAGVAQRAEAEELLKRL